MAAIQAFDLYRFFHTRDSETLALRGVNLRIEAGEMIAMVGPSGSGKSTLLSCLAGLDEPDGGYVELSGERLTTLRPEAVRASRRAEGIGILMQPGNLFPTLSIADNVRLPMAMIGKPNAARIGALLHDVDLTDRQHARPGHLSGGEAARAGLAVALATSPRVLFADEPTGQVDAAAEERVLDLLGRQRAAGTAILIATHSQALAGRADRVIRLEDGRIVDV
ncbi:ABC transporter ATP-binding protein [Bradyrhizobium sp. UASWS1016]|jgi:putative ABC transport system ATP-binding protein|uniref:ABC transporter ATP-binding protein n=2 Tax=Nitrobacteraceae TaxID=41294 RepID=A0A5P6PJT4_9BRAD|nr:MULTISPECIES: ABC transporter ATP-binding protein [Bradyrhizobium]MCW5703411.1 ABC transporter ATP-binding protein [Bradyrhizobium sp.]OYU86539.1 MAG: ABC transporter ATP-binding protein [Bradyrhizobiaceae bacterium PARB1]AUD00325.1 ABC transporter ATP-binding protein [Bradyrhizobium sp. SK17]MCS3730959.1 putative ABC transport system ATP-binding protein [Bradyrhizobium betae]OCX32613.1 ABC transporter ATP-binding protein [Bradyrhizobium sp. UASWS1016]